MEATALRSSSISLWPLRRLNRAARERATRLKLVTSCRKLPAIMSKRADGLGRSQEPAHPPLARAIAKLQPKAANPRQKEFLNICMDQQIEIYSHHQIEWWIAHAEPGAEFFMHLTTGRASDPNPNRDFQELANRDAAFAHSYEILKRATDARLVEMQFKRGCLIVTRLGPQAVATTNGEQEGGE